MNVKGKVGSTRKWILLLIRANNFKSKIYRHRLGELIISLQVPRINLLMIFHVFFKHMGYFMVKAVLRSRHFFGRLRIQTSEFPEPLMTLFNEHLKKFKQIISITGTVAMFRTVSNFW